MRLRLFGVPSRGEAGSICRKGRRYRFIRARAAVDHNGLIDGRAEGADRSRDGRVSGVIGAADTGIVVAKIDGAEIGERQDAPGVGTAWRLGNPFGRRPSRPRNPSVLAEGLPRRFVGDGNSKRRTTK